MNARNSPLASLALALLMSGCGDSELARREAAVEAMRQSSETPPKPSPSPPPAAATSVPPQDPEVPALWDNDIAIARAVGEGGYMKAITTGKPFTVKDSVTGSTRTLTIPQTLVDADNNPVAWPVAAGHGFVPTSSQDETSKEAVVLHFELVWDPTAETLGGRMGMFQAVGFELAAVADDVHWRYEKQGEYWVRRSGPKP